MITLWQPWGSWIALGWKTIETRLHGQFKHLLGKEIGIHAGKRWDNEALRVAGPYLTMEQMHITEELRAIQGSVLCTAVVRNFGVLDHRHSQAALIDCANTRRYGLFLYDVKPLPFRVLAKGSQGVWTYRASEQQTA